MPYKMTLSVAIRGEHTWHIEDSREAKLEITTTLAAMASIPLSSLVEDLKHEAIQKYTQLLDDQTAEEALKKEDVPL